MRTITLQFHVEDDAPELKENNGRLTLSDVAAYLGSALADKAGDSPTFYSLSAEAIRRQADALAANDYRETVSDIVADLTRAVRDGEVTDRDDVETWLHETIDGHGDVIYTSRAMEVCRQSSNDGAYFEEFGDEGAVSDGGIEWSKLAYCALMADVREELGDVEDRFFKCSDCGCDVESDRVKAAAESENLPQCADCAGETDEDEDDEDGEDDQSAD